MAPWHATDPTRWLRKPGDQNMTHYFPVGAVAAPCGEVAVTDMVLAPDITITPRCSICQFLLNPVSSDDITSLPSPEEQARIRPGLFQPDGELT